MSNLFSSPVPARWALALLALTALANPPAVATLVSSPATASSAAAQAPAKPAAKPATKPAARPGKPAPRQANKAAPKPPAKVVAPKAAAAVAPKLATGAVADLPGWCHHITPHLSGLTPQRCQAAALLAGDGRSVRGVPLWHRDVGPVGKPPRVRVLVLGGIHGDEMASVNVVFDWLERSLKNPQDRIQWRMVPLVNPDGLMNKPSTRVNARGVDLNRNFPTPDWATAANSYWVHRTGKDPRRFPGHRALSEPETQWLQKQVDQFRPHLIVSVHAPYGVLDFDGPPPPPDKMGSLHLDQVGIYPGSLGNYGGVVRRVPVVTLELRNAAKVAPAEVAAMWADLLGWIDQRMETIAQAKPLVPTGH
jgi:hypothetical protein